MAVHHAAAADRLSRGKTYCGFRFFFSLLTLKVSCIPDAQRQTPTTHLHLFTLSCQPLIACIARLPYKHLSPRLQYGRCCASIYAASFQGTCNAGSASRQDTLSHVIHQATALASVKRRSFGLSAGASHPQPAVRNHGGGATRAMRPIRQISAEQTQCRSQQESGVRRVPRPNLSDQYGLVLRQQRRPRKGKAACTATNSAASCNALNTPPTCCSGKLTLLLPNCLRICALLVLQTTFAADCTG